MAGIVLAKLLCRSANITDLDLSFNQLSVSRAGTAVRSSTQRDADSKVRFLTAARSVRDRDRPQTRDWHWCFLFHVYVALMLRGAPPNPDES